MTRSGYVRTLHQDSEGVPGVAEAGDAFGAAVALRSGTFVPRVVVGAPGEDIGSEADAGAVYRRYLRAGYRTGIEYAGHGLPGVPRSGDRLGATLATAVGSDGSLDPVVGVPGADLDGRRDAGTVYLHGVLHPETDLVTLTLSTGPTRSTRYGEVLGADGAAQ